jgi:hypothetical protein
VVRVDTPSVAAKVVDVELVGDWPDEDLVDDSVSDSRSPHSIRTLLVEECVAGGLEVAAGPFPTSWLGPDPAFDAVFERASHLVTYLTAFRSVPK